MTSDQTVIARRAVACAGWRYMRGMIVAFGYGAQGVVTGYAPRRSGWVPVSWDGGTVSEHDPSTLLPVLDSPATKGCLTGLVRQAWGEPLLYAVPVEDGLWMVPEFGPLGLPIPISGSRYSRSEEEALVVALEAAP